MGEGGWAGQICSRRTDLFREPRQADGRLSSSDELWGSAPGPPDEPRSVPAGDFYARVRGLAPTLGVTRLADVTRLDRLGLPVWQAVRPAARGLSVHQGKGATHLAARIGALCEAIECACAEQVQADGPCSDFDSLPPEGKARDLADYSRIRSAVNVPSEPISWCEAGDWLTGKRCFLPHELVSLDFVPRGGGYFESCSSGLGVGATEAEAVETGLLELLERDCVGKWQRMGPLERAEDELDIQSLPCAWFGDWLERLGRLDIELRVFAPEAIANICVMVCWIAGREEYDGGRRAFSGSSAHRDPERALFKALAEAIQSRLTWIAGVRDDILPSNYCSPGGDPVPFSQSFQRAWSGLETPVRNFAELAEGIAEQGFRQIAVKRLDQGLDGVAAVKVFVPGLGSLTRTRRCAG